jgi:hypothetical protein
VNAEVLHKTRIWTVVAAGGTAVILGFFLSPLFGFGLFATALWAVLSFWVLERLLRAVVVPPGTPRNIFAVIAWVGAKIALYGIAVWALLTGPFPAWSLVSGLTLLLVVLVAVGISVSARVTRQPTQRGDDG